MRIQVVIFLLLFSTLHISAKVFAQKITLNLKQQPLEKAFLEIEKATGMAFFGPSSLMEKSKPVTLQLNEASLEEALKEVFREQPLTYEIIGKMIKIMEKNIVSPVKTPPLKVRGKVTSINNDPLIGVSVRLRGTNVGTITDQNGNYQIDGDSEGVLVFTFVGYQAMQIKINNQTEINLTLIEFTSELNETVVKGYYNTTKELNTGNVSTVKADEIARQPVGDPMAALIGKVPGLYVQQTSGVTGRRFNVRLRGQNSLDNGNDPLFIVDGVQYNSNAMNVSNSVFTAGGQASPFNYLNPADIESIEVLKDADATAIYGSRGANGVILITTKKAKEGQLEFDARYYSGISRAPRRIEFMDTKQYLSMRREAFDNDKKQPGVGDYDLNGTWDTTRNTNWQKYFTGNTAPVNDISIGLSMGANNTAIRIGAGYRSEGTIYPGDFRSIRAGANFSATHSALHEKFNLSISGSYGYSQNNLPVGGGIVEQFITLAPNAPDPYNEDGTLNWANGTWANPMAQYEQTATEKAKTLITNLSISYKVWKQLTVKTNLGYTTTNFKQNNLRPWSSANPGTTQLPSTYRQHQVLSNDISTFVIEPQLSYSELIFEGDLDILIGGTLQGSTSDNFGFSATGFNSDALLTNLAAGTAFTNFTRTSTQYKYSAAFARIGYAYKHKYVLNLTTRRDASSRFGPGKKAGNFGAIGAAWIFTNEDFMKKYSGVFSFGKLRFSYGSTGNDQLGEYKYLDTYSIFNIPYQGNSSLTPTQLTNPLYGWERVNKLEFALELGFLDGRINVNSSYYRNRTDNQLVLVPLPTTTGFQNVRANLPATIQNSGFEFDIRSTNIEKRRFGWSTTFNLTIPKNKLLSFPNIETSSYARKYVVGEPINSLAFRYQYTGIDPTTGLFTFKDINGDGNLTTAQDLLPTYIGQRFYGAMYNNFKIGLFEFDFQFQFVKQNGFGYFNNGIAGSFGGTRGNQPVIDNKYDRQPFTMSSAIIANQESLFLNSTGQIVDASFVRLKNAGIYFMLPTEIKAIKRSKIYIQGQNLATFSNYRGFDPESPGTGIVVAPLRTITAGLQLTL